MNENPPGSGASPTQVDVIVVGAGAAGLYALHRLRGLGLQVQVFEEASGVGGTWFWNRYPGARCDVQSWDYCYSFSEELELEWDWTERYPTQDELERYFNHVADRFDLRRNIAFDTRVEHARFDEGQSRWIIDTSKGTSLTARFFVSAVGALSQVNIPRFEGAETFRGQTLHTARWPEEGVDFEKKRVGVIGTGSSGAQLIPQLAKQADHLFVFQRTPQYAVPANNRSLDDDARNELKNSFHERRELKRTSSTGLATPAAEVISLLAADADTRADVLEEAWHRAAAAFCRTFDDVMTNRQANELAAEFVRGKIRAKVDDPAVADTLLAIESPIGTRRLIAEIDYFETYNRANVTLVDLAASPIEEITPNGLRTKDDEYDLDLLVYATGFDGMTGALLSMDIEGLDGRSLRDKWATWPATYLGLVASGFPNLFMITGPGSPAVLSNVILSIEQHVEWIADCLAYMVEHDFDCIDAEPRAEAEWTRLVADIADQTLVVKTNSWWTGANIPGKPRGLPMYLGGTQNYRVACDDVAADGYRGFVLSSSAATSQPNRSRPSTT
jgi:cation diffusion facilitator CzcD-associated flavoprotein CzcO